MVKPTILQFIPHGNRQAGGGEIYVDALSKGLVKIGYNVIHMEITGDASLRPHCDDGVYVLPVYQKHLDGISRYLRINTYACLRSAIRSAVKGEGLHSIDGLTNLPPVNLIHCHSNHTPFGLYVLGLAKRYGVPSVLTSHLSERKEGNYKDMISKGIIFCTSSLATKRLAVCNGAGQVSFLPFENVGSFVDTILFDPQKADRERFRQKYKISSGDVVIGYAARIIGYKRQEKLIDVIGMLKDHQNYKLFLAGTIDDEEYYNACQKMIVDYDIKDRVFFVGESNSLEGISNPHTALSREGMRDFYAALDIYCQPSDFEGFPLTVLEAMAMGKTIVTMDQPWVDEFDDFPGMIHVIKSDNLIELVFSLIQSGAPVPNLRSRGVVESKCSLAELVRKHDFVYTDLLEIS